MDRYAVFGNPIAQSKSPEIHAQFALQTSEAIEYSKQLVALDEFTRAARIFFESGGKGLNVTVPFKEEAYQFADLLTGRAQAAGAVNTLAIQADGRILGDNTDGAGLVHDIVSRLGWTIKGKKLLILGAGGAVKGVLLPVLNASPFSICVANRTLSKAQELADKFSHSINNIPVDGVRYEDLDGEKFDLVINGTSASLGGEVPKVPASCLGANFCAYDMVYGKEPTAFMKWADELGAAEVSDGYGMLLCQAAESFYLWRGIKPDC